MGIAYHLPAMSWDRFLGLSRTDRSLLIKSLNRLLDKREAAGSVTGLPPHRENKF